ncbi:hypothetical protein NEOLEDRAFT_1078428, partial [Neolentinus lepideus HHB14362 ss-1]
STHNTRIERLWVEVGTQFARRWRAFLTRLGRLHRLDRKNSSHLWLLHKLYLVAINDDCREFQVQWNAHPISGRRTKNRSPADLCFLGQTEHGVYAEEPLDHIHPDILNRYYGVEGHEQHRHASQTGAGHAEDEDLDDDSEVSDAEDIEPEDEFVQEILASQAQNIRHKPIPVPRARSPFDSSAAEDQFMEILTTVSSQGLLPPHYGVLPHEWDDGAYPEEEVIKFGTRGKQLRVVLPETIWFPRAVLWTQALDIMNRLVLEEEALEV